MLIILSYLLTVSLVSVVMSLYCQSIVSIYTPVILLTCAITYGVSYLTKKQKALGGILVCIMVIVSLYITGYGANIGRNEAGTSFWQWVLTAGDEANEASVYVLTLCFCASVFFAFIVYYFSIALFRSSYLTLISLLPCVLYIKVMVDMNNWYLILIAGLNMAIYYFRKAAKRDSNSLVCGFKGQVVSFLAFTFFILLLCAAIPKNSDAMFFDEFENLFLNGDTTSALSGDYGDMSDFSGNADNYRAGSNRRLYNLNSINFSYLKRQNFDYYDFDEDRWYSEDDINFFTDKEWEEIAGDLSIGNMQMVIKEAAKKSPEFSSKYNISNIVKRDILVEPLCSINIGAQNFGAVYYLQAARGVKVESGENIPYTVSDRGVFLLDKRHSPNANYKIFYYDNYSVVRDWIALGGANFSIEETGELLQDCLRILKNEESPNTKIVESFIKQYDAACTYKRLISENTDKISDEIKQLAYSITKDCKYDWDKAQRLADYFEKNNFVYDLDKIFEDTSPEYFLFESKTGTCSDYASAYVLMARAVGLIVRYSEGYVPEQAQTGFYYINEKDAHAYPEVYIENAGWIVYEPTVASNEAMSFKEYFSKISVDFKLIYALIGIIVGVVVLSLLARIFLPLLDVMVYKIHLLLLTEDKKALLTYKRILKLATKKGIENPNSLTPKELAESYYLSTGTDISGIATQVEQIAYKDIGT